MRESTRGEGVEEMLRIYLEHKEAFDVSGAGHLYLVLREEGELVGGLGDDLLHGGAGDLTPGPGDGIDTADYATSPDRVEVDLPRAMLAAVY